MATRALKLLIAGDADGALKALRAVGDQSDTLGKRLVGLGKTAAIGLGAAGAAAAVFAKSAIDAAAESQKISKITEQLVKTTGGAAKISAEQVGELATALSNKTAIDDEAIQSAANLILTFKNVRNEAGKGNDIFNRATAAALDLSTVLGTDASGAAMQLAKALDNPIKGVTALTRSGVNFSAQQKEQIKTLVESGKTLEAQRIILKEVESQVGGAAAAGATDAERAKVAFGNLQEQIGSYLLPVVEKVSNYLVTTFIPKLAELADRYGPAVGAAFTRLGEIMKPVFEWLRVNVPIIFDRVKEIVSGVIAAITGFWEKHKEDITRIVGALWDALKGVIEGGVRIVKGIIDVFLGVFQGDWDRVWNGLKGIVSGAWTGIVAVIKNAGPILLDTAKWVFGKVVEGATAAASMLWRMLSAFPDVVSSFFLKASTWLLKAGGDIVEGLIKGIDSKKGALAKAALNLAGWITNPFGKAIEARSPSLVFMEYGYNIADGLIIGMTAKSPQVEQAAVAMASAVTGPMAGEAARNGGQQLAKTIFAAMAGEAARGGVTVYTPLIASMAGEAARNGNQVAKPLFAAMAGEAARNGAQQIAGALRSRLEVQARDLGYDMGTAMSEEITGSLDEVIAKMSKKLRDNINIGGGGGAGGGGGGGATGTIGGGGGGGEVPGNVADLYARFGGTYGDWARRMLGELTDWNSKWNPAGSPQVRPFAPNPISGGTLLDANGNPVYADDPTAIRDALSGLVPQMAAGGVVTAPTLALIGEAGPEAVVPLNRGGTLGDITINVTGSVISERDLVETIRKALIRDQQQGKVLIPS